MVRERRDFIELTPIERMRLIDALCSNLSVLSASVTAAVVSGASADEAHAETMFGYRQALKAYATFIFHVCEVCEKESKECAAMACAQSPRLAPRGRRSRRIRQSWRSGRGTNSVSAATNRCPRHQP